MNAKDQAKIIDAGFTIIRKEFSTDNKMPHRIKAKTKEKREWHTLENKFPSKAALERRFDELLNYPFTVED